MNYISSSELKFQWFTFCWLISMDNYAVMKNTFGVPSKCYNIFILCQLQKKIAAFHKFTNSCIMMAVQLMEVSISGYDEPTKDSF